MTDDDLALTVPCPYFYLGRRCAGNAVGAPCRNMVDGELRRPHAERIEAARKARVVAKAIADLPDLPMPFSAAQRAEVLDTVIDDPTPPRAMALVREHFLRTATAHGVRPGEPRGDRTAQDHMRGLDRHLLRMARLTGPDYDLDAIDEQIEQALSEPAKHSEDGVSTEAVPLKEQLDARDRIAARANGRQRRSGFAATIVTRFRTQGGGAS